MPTRPPDDVELIEQYDASDAYEQERSDDLADEEQGVPDTLPFEAPEADVLEQHQLVPTDDGEEYEG